MLKKLAVKRLTASDLTFFVWHFRNQPAGNQKAINLNADVFGASYILRCPKRTKLNQAGFRWISTSMGPARKENSTYSGRL